MYPEEFTKPMEEELVSAGFLALKTPEEVHEHLPQETTLLIINSVCGCGAKNARPGVLQAIEHERAPKKLLTVFAGVDHEATSAARNSLTHVEPSSPMIVILKDGEPTFTLERKDIVYKEPEEIAQDLIQAFEKIKE